MKGLNYVLYVRHHCALRLACDGRARLFFHTPWIVLLLILLAPSAPRADEPAATMAAPATSATPVAVQGDAETKPPRNAKPGDKPSGDQAQPSADKKPDGEKKDGPGGDEKSKDKKSDDNAPINHPAKPDKPADPNELKVKPDENGMVSFSFKGQPWQAVLEWLADISHMSLDWQEVPGGYLDLFTRRKYTVDEARDLINSILLTKGFTLLRNGEVLIVANLKNLDVSLVPFVTPKELDRCGTFEVVRTFFDLSSLQAEPMAEELKPLLSPLGKEHISALKTTNRIDIVETAGNLRRIREIVGAEQGDSGKEHQLKEYPLRYARADDVLTTLKELLGMPPDKEGPAGPQDMQRQMQQQQQMMQQMQQMQQQQGGKGGAQKPQQEDKVYLAINRRENSIMAVATPDKLAVIEQAVNFLDVPSAARSPLAGLSGVQMYRLVAADPAPIVAVLKDMGNLDPSTRLEVDNVNKAIIVSGPLVDHVTVKSLIDKLDGSARQFEVIQLRKLDADYVAGSIDFLMHGQKQDNNRPRYFWDGGGRQNDAGKDGGFQVEADTKNNRLLLHANQIEMDEIRALMVKLGEDPFVNAHNDNLHIIHSTPGRDTDVLLEKLKRIWPNVSSTPLDISAEQPQQPAGDGAAPDKQSSDRKDRDPSDKPANTDDNSAPANQEKKPEKAQPAAPTPSATATMTLPLGQQGIEANVAASGSDPMGWVAGHENSSILWTPPTIKAYTNDVFLAADVEPAKPNADNAPTTDSDPSPIMKRFGGDRRGTTPTSATIDSKAGPPISITRTPQGLVVTSRDQASLDQFMKLIDELSPADSHYHIYNLKHADAKDVAILMESVFQDAGAKKDNTNSRIFYIWDEPPPDSKERNRLSKREPLRFIADPVTNSILVKGADDEQLAQIQALIEIYDRATPPDSPLIRHTKMVHIKYAKAQAVADVVKDVYRDLLSPNDKALISAQQQQQPKSQPLFSYFDTDSGSGSKTPADGLKFKGLLSIGVDTTSNTLLVSSPQFLMDGVLDMIKTLDEQTKPVEPMTRVINLGGMSTDPVLMDALKAIADPAAAKNAAAKSSRDQEQQRNNNRNNRNNRNGQNGGNNGWNNGGGWNGGQNNNR